jgi:hypothetical protein
MRRSGPLIPGVLLGSSTSRNAFHEERTGRLASKHNEVERVSSSFQLLRDDFEKFTVPPLKVAVDRPHNKKERIAFYEISQTLVVYDPNADGTLRRRVGPNINRNHTTSQEEAKASRNAGNYGCRRSVVERCTGRTAAANPATFPATTADATKPIADAAKQPAGASRCR